MLVVEKIRERKRGRERKREEEKGRERKRNNGRIA